MKKRETVKNCQKTLCAANEILNRVMYIPEVLEIIDDVSHSDEIFTALKMCALKRWMDPDSYDYQSEYSYDFKKEEVAEIRENLANDLFFGPILTKLRLIISDYLGKFWGKQYFSIIDFLIMNRILAKVMQGLMQKNHRGHSTKKQTLIRKKFKAEAYKIAFSLEFLIRFEERYDLLDNKFNFAVPEADYTEYKKLGLKPRIKFGTDDGDDDEYPGLVTLDKLLIERARHESLDPVLFLCLSEIASRRDDLDSYTDEISDLITKGGRIFWRNGDSVDLSQFNLKMYLLPFLFKNLDNLVFTSNVLDAEGGLEDEDEDDWSVEDNDDDGDDGDDGDDDDDDFESSIGQKGSQNSTNLSYCFEYAIGIREDHYRYMDEDPFTLCCYSDDWTVSRTIKIASAKNKNSDVFLLTFWNDKIFIDRHVAGRSKHPDLLG